MTDRGQPNILLLQLEFPLWEQARAWTYPACYGVAEGLRAAGARCTTIPLLANVPYSVDAWLAHARQGVSGKQFDQVWVWLVHSPLTRPVLDWISTLAPIRVGIVMESLTYDEADYAWAGHLRSRLDLVASQSQALTHVLVPDETDVDHLHCRVGVQTLWWPPMVPARFIVPASGPPSYCIGVFHGQPYGPRQSWLSHQALRQRLQFAGSGQPATYFQQLFDQLQNTILQRLSGRGLLTATQMADYQATLEEIRLGEFKEWMAHLQQWAAIVNLPSLAKFYGGRVYEGIAAGRPVLTYAIPHHPLNNRLFADGQEVLFFSPDSPESLAERLDHLLRDEPLAGKIAVNAQRKLMRYHTSEYRLAQTLRWLESASLPDYGIDEVSERGGAIGFISEQDSSPVGGGSMNENAVSAPSDLAERTAAQRRRFMADLTGFTAPVNDQSVCVTGPSRDREATSDFVKKTSGGAMDSDTFYVNLFVNQPAWSTPHPNADESARWSKIAAFLEHILRRVRQSEPGKQLRMIEVGCGRGWLTNLASMYGTCEGIEPVAGVIEHARRLFPHLRFETGAAQQVLQRSDFSPYDVVLCSEVIEHVPHGQKDAFVEELAKLLKPGGFLILTTPRGEMWERWKSIAPPNQPVEDWVTEDQLRGIFASQGFCELGLERVHVEVPNLRFVPAPTPADLRSMNLLPIYQVWVCQRTAAPLPIPFTRPPKVSVIVPTYNRPDRLRMALESLAAQTFQDFEVIVVNDAGCEVGFIIAARADRHRITTISHDRNRGLAAARNSGLRAAKGIYIAYLDDDDRYLPNHLETLVGCLDRHECCVAYTDAWRVHERQIDGMYVETGRDVPYSYDFSPADLLVSNYFPVLCVMHARQCLEEVGYFDESLFAHEDWDLWIRMATRFPFKHLPVTTAEFTWRSDGTSMTSGTRDTYKRTTELIYRKYAPYAELIAGVREGQQCHFERLFAQRSPTSLTCSIIIPTWNKVELTMQCLTALASNTGNASFEVIIVDNGSTDGTQEFLSTLGGDVQLILNKENLGFAKACNQGARVARGKYLVFLNNDTIPQPGWLSSLVSEVDAHPEVGVVGSKLLYPDGTVQHAGVVRDCQHLFPYHIYKSFDGSHPVVNRRREFQIVTAACLLIRRSLYEDVGGFDEKYVNGFEDVDLCLKVRERGHVVVYQPRSVVVHLEGQTPGRKQNEDANAARFLDRWGNQWWAADEDLHFHIDGYKLKRIFRNGNVGGDIVLLEGIKDRASWAHVAAVQTAALKEDWEAVKRELRLVEDWPNDQFVLSWGAMMAERLQESGSRTKFLSRYLALVDEPAERLALIRMLLEQKNLAGAEEHLELLLASSPSDAEALFMQGILFMQREQYEQAERALGSAMREGANRKKCLMGMGMAAMGRAYTQGAWERFLQVLAEYPDDGEAIHWLLRAGTAQNRWQELGEQLRTYVARNPGDLTIRLAFASVLLRSEQVEAARREYDEIRKSAPSYDGLDQLGQAITGREAVLAMEGASS